MLGMYVTGVLPTSSR